MKRTILKNVGIGLCFLLSTGTVCAQNYPGKVKNAQGIEVIILFSATTILSAVFQPIK